MTQKIITFLVLLWFLFGITKLDTTNLWSINNSFSFIGFAVFIIYFIYSINNAIKKNDTKKS